VPLTYKLNSQNENPTEKMFCFYENEESLESQDDVSLTFNLNKKIQTSKHFPQNKYQQENNNHKVAIISKIREAS